MTKGGDQSDEASAVSLLRHAERSEASFETPRLRLRVAVGLLWVRERNVRENDRNSLRIARITLGNAREGYSALIPPLSSLPLLALLARLDFHALYEGVGAHHL